MGKIKDPQLFLLIKNFLLVYLPVQRKLSGNTVTTYRTVLNQFLAHVAGGRRHTGHGRHFRYGERGFRQCLPELAYRGQGPVVFDQEQPARGIEGVRQLCGSLQAGIYQPVR